MKEILLVFLGGGTGSALRFLLQQMIAGWYAGSFPLGTMLVNIAGSFLIGCFIGHPALSGSGHWGRFLLIAGFCGGFTTFSAFSGDTLQLLCGGNWTTALLYALLSFVLCIAGTALGTFATR